MSAASLAVSVARPGVLEESVQLYRSAVVFRLPLQQVTNYVKTIEKPKRQRLLD